MDPTWLVVDPTWLVVDLTWRVLDPSFEISVDPYDLVVSPTWLVLDLFESTRPSDLFRAVSTTSEVGSLETSSRTPDCGAGAVPEHDSRDGVDTAGLT